jgi:uncharacterized membrane protein YecN with MAPEG domain
MYLYITSLYAAVLVCMYVLLSLRVSILRKKYNAALGSGSHLELKRFIRVHGNFSEYVPVFLILLGIMEINQYSLDLLNSFGSVFLVARVCHMVGVGKIEKFSSDGKKSRNKGFRIFGTFLTYATLFTMGLTILLYPL